MSQVMSLRAYISPQSYRFWLSSLSQYSDQQKLLSSFFSFLRNSNILDDILIVFDNLAIHKNREIKSLMDELSFSYTYTPVASP